MSASADRAEALVKRIATEAADMAKAGATESFGLACAGILSGQLIKALERIDRLEGDIQLLVDLLANVEGKS